MQQYLEGTGRIEMERVSNRDKEINEETVKITQGKEKMS